MRHCNAFARQLSHPEKMIEEKNPSQNIRSSLLADSELVWPALNRKDIE